MHALFTLAKRTLGINYGLARQTDRHTDVQQSDP